MTICKNCGTVFDEYYGVCPKCGTIYTPDAENTAPAEAEAPKAPEPDLSKLINETPKPASSEIPVVDNGSAPDLDATIPVGAKPFDPDATVPMAGKPFDPDATIAMSGAPVQPQSPYASPAPSPYAQQAPSPYAPPQVQDPYAPPADKNFGQTQDVILPPNAQAGQYGDQYSSAETVVSVRNAQPPKKKGSGAKIAVIIIIVCIVLAGLGVGAYFLWFRQQPDNSAEQSSQASDPETLRSNAQGLNMSVINLYAGVTNGMITSSSSADELKGIDPAKLPAPAASSAEKEEKANALTVQDVVNYSEKTDIFNASTIGNYAYGGAEIFYKDDKAGTPLTMDTTIGQIRNAAPAEQSKPEESSRPEESSKPEESSSVEQSSDTVDPETMRKNAQGLYMSTINLYTAVTTGNINSSTPASALNGLDPTRLPAATASNAQKEAMANALTMQDVITYSGKTAVFDASAMEYYGYGDGEIFYKGDKTGASLTMYTTIGEIRGVEEQSSQPSYPEPTDMTEKAATLDLAAKSLYTEVVAGSVNKSSPGLVDPAHLPDKNAPIAKNAEAAKKLTIADAIAYGNLSSVITEADVAQFVASNGNICYKGDASGIPLTMDTVFYDALTQAQISQPEPSEPSDDDIRAKVNELNYAVKGLYAEVIAGTINKSNTGNVDPDVLPAKNASMAAKKAAAEALTVVDAVDYAGLYDKIYEEDLDEMVYAGGAVYCKDDSAGTPLTEDTTLGEILNSTQTSQPEPSTTESSVPENVKKELAGKWTSVFNTGSYSQEQISDFIKELEWEEFDIIINANGTASAYYISGGQTEIIGEGTWTFSDNELTVSIDGGDESFTYDNGKLYSANLMDVVWFEKS